MDHTDAHLQMSTSSSARRRARGQVHIEVKASFCSHSQNLDALASVWISVVHLSSEHLQECRAQGPASTMWTLESV